MSNLRQDPISGDWVIIAPKRAARPHFLDAKREPRKVAPRDTCPFEESFMKKHDAWPPEMALPHLERWRAIVMPNKYPAVTNADVCSIPLREGIYMARTGVGKHNLVITRDHRHSFIDLSAQDAETVFHIFQKMCRRVAEDPCDVYAVPFLNWGPLAGASVGHPHYQFISLPIVPSHSAHSLAGAKHYAKKHHACARCDMIRFEKAEARRGGANRVVAARGGAIAVAPYASKFACEIRIMPTAHEPYFYKTSPRIIRDVVRVTQDVLRMMKKQLKDPDINFLIHEAPLDGKRYDYHHWHLEIIPRITTPAGFELSTGIYINTIAPEAAAALLRGEKYESRD